MTNLLQIAKYDLWVAKLVMNTRTDEAAIRNGAYHLQQALEKALKFAINRHGLTYSRTHDISELIHTLNGTNLVIPQNIRSMASIVTGWQSRVRYTESLRVRYTDVSRAIQDVESFIISLASIYNIILLE